MVFCFNLVWAKIGYACPESWISIDQNPELLYQHRHYESRIITILNQWREIGVFFVLFPVFGYIRNPINLAPLRVDHLCTKTGPVSFLIPEFGSVHLSTEERYRLQLFATGRSLQRLRVCEILRDKLATWMALCQSSLFDHNDAFISLSWPAMLSPLLIQTARLILFSCLNIRLSGSHSLNR